MHQRNLDAVMTLGLQMVIAFERQVKVKYLPALASGSGGPSVTSTFFKTLALGWIEDAVDAIASKFPGWGTLISLGDDVGVAALVAMQVGPSVKNPMCNDALTISQMALVVLKSELARSEQSRYFLDRVRIAFKTRDITSAHVRHLKFKLLEHSGAVDPSFIVVLGLWDQLLLNIETFETY